MNGGGAPSAGSLTRPIKRALLALLLLALPFSGWIVVERIALEGTRTEIAVLIDERSLRVQAAALGLDTFELGLHYQRLGLSGIALYEHSVESLARAGGIVALSGEALRAAAVAQGEDPPDVPGYAVVISEIVPGAAADLLAKNHPSAQRLTFAGRTWWWWPGGAFDDRPAGPDREELRRWVEAGFDIGYRPLNSPGLREVGSDFPEEARYLIHAKLQVVGHPHALDQTIAASQGRFTALIEGTPQFGMEEVAAEVPTLRLLSFAAEYQNQRLSPADLIEKYLLAANERHVRILYLRAYTEEQQGDMLANTEELIVGLYAALAADGFRVAPLTPPDAGLQPPLLARAMAAVGVIAGTLLLLSTLPLAWAGWVALLLTGLGLLAGGLSWASVALVAALSFPVLGFALLPWRAWTLPAATGISLIGAALLSAVGSDRASMLALEPFAGVGATLVVPPALFALIVLLRHGSAALWLRRAWGYRPSIGEIAVALLALAALALVFIRRGNFPIIGASEIELALRSTLNELFVRPRFKELLGHPLAMVGLLMASWPWWARGGLLVAGVVAQASILNSFSHYHTPLWVSFQRTALALILGMLAGWLLYLVVRAAERMVRRWLERP